MSGLNKKADIGTGARPDVRIADLGRGLFIFGGGPLLLFGLMVFQLTQGQAHIGWQTVLETFTTGGQESAHHIVRGVRLPRAVMGLLAGGALAVSGVLLQTLTRNPLASAGTLGINAGAYLAVVAASIFAPVLLHTVSFGLALMGGLAAALFAYVLAGGMRATPVRMALAGMIVTMMLSAFTGALQLIYEYETNGLFLWGSGSLVQNDWGGVRYSWPLIVTATAVSLLMARTLDLMELDEEVGRSLGQRINRARMVVLLVAVWLAAVSVSVVGPIGFVGLIAPHLIRLLGYRRHRWLLPASFIWGAIVLVGADAVVLTLEKQSGMIPAGAITALIGGPWLIVLIRRMNRNRRGTMEGSERTVYRESGSAVPFPVTIVVTVLLLFAALGVGMSVGSHMISLSELWATMRGGGSDLTRMILFDLRLPRMLVAALAGAALAVSGLLLQGVVRNPLADPSIIGVTAGAGIGALLLLLVFPQFPVAWLPMAAFIGGMAAAAATFFVNRRDGLQPTSLALTGIAVSAMGTAFIQILVVKAQLKVAVALSWIVGSTYARGWQELLWLIAWPAILIPVGWLLARRLDLLALGDSSATGLGLHVGRARLHASVVGVALASAAVATVGTVGFVGLMAPHAARLLVGNRHRLLVPFSALLGAVLLLLADWFGRTAIAPKEIPSGLIVALIGAPYFLWLMRSNKARG